MATSHQPSSTATDHILSPLTLVLLQLATGEIPRPDRELREAQARFEFVRRAHLPVVVAGGSRCDVRVGRFCYWYDSAPPPRVPEAREITTARERLLAVLDSAARTRPSDAWIAGQRIRYLLDAARPADALEVGCGARPWWCAALRGMALHYSGDYASAELSFKQALNEMPPALRCEWADIRLLLEPALAREMERLSCAERERFAARLWRLAQPLWISGGSDVRTEYLSRRVMAMVLDGTVSPHGLRWAGDTRELLLRYGWSDSYTRSPPIMSTVSWEVTAHAREPSWNVLPSLSGLGDRWIARDDWQLRDPLARMRYSPRHVSALHDLPHQLIRVPRGDSMLVAVAMHPSAQRGGARVGLGVLRRGSEVALTPGESTAASAVWITRQMTSRDTTVVSIEALADSGGRAARARYSIAPPSCTSACLSDLLLFKPVPGRDSLRLDEALGRAILPTLSRESPLGVWWELEAPPGATLAMRLTLEPARPNPFRRLAERLGLAESRSTIRLRWQVVSRPGNTVNQVVLRLPEGARGAYRLSLTAQPQGAPPVTALREIHITDR